MKDGRDMWLERLQTGTVAPGHHDNNRCWQTNRCHISLSRRPLCMCALAYGCAGERERAGVYLSARERTGVGLVFSSLFFRAHMHLWHSQETGDERRQYTYISLPHTATSFPPSRSPPLSLTARVREVTSSFFLSYLILQSSSSFTFISCIFPFITFILATSVCSRPPSVTRSLIVFYSFHLFLLVSFSLWLTSS